MEKIILYNDHDITAAQAPIPGHLDGWGLQKGSSNVSGQRGN